MLVIATAVLLAVLFLLPYMIARLIGVACFVVLLIIYPLILLPAIVLLIGAFFLFIYFH